MLQISHEHWYKRLFNMSTWMCEPALVSMLSFDKWGPPATDFLCGYSNTGPLCLKWASSICFSVSERNKWPNTSEEYTFERAAESMPNERWIEQAREVEQHDRAAMFCLQKINATQNPDTEKLTHTTWKKRNTDTRVNYGTYRLAFLFIQKKIVWAVLCKAKVS